MELSERFSQQRRFIVIARDAAQEKTTCDHVSSYGTTSSGRQKHRRHPTTRVDAARPHRDDVIVGASRGRLVGHDGSRASDTVRLPVSALPRQQADLYSTARLRFRRTTATPIDRPDIAQI